jgi:hypothetical protein
MSNYPPLRLAALNQLVDLKNSMRTDPEYLTHEDCPYDNETKDLLRDLLAATTVEVAVEKIIQGEGRGRGRPSKEIRLGEDDQKIILEGIKTTLKELDDMAKSAVETSEKIQVAKTRTSLLDQLLKMQERHTAIGEVGKFIDSVIGLLDDLVDEKGRETMMARLEPFR